VKERIAAEVNQQRRAANLSALPRQDLSVADSAACSMTQADKLGTSPIQQLAVRYTVLSYNTLHPETLPVESEQAIASRNLRSFSVGVCYGRTETYPTGAYWVVLTLD